MTFRPAATHVVGPPGYYDFGSAGASSMRYVAYASGMPAPAYPALEDGFTFASAPEAQASKIILPPGLQEEIEAERAQAAKDRVHRAFAASYGPVSRRLTDEECIERFGAPLADLREGVTFWERELARMPRWGARKAKREVRRSLVGAIMRRDLAEHARVLDQG